MACIPNRKFYNGVEDCDDGSDEPHFCKKKKGKLQDMQHYNLKPSETQLYRTYLKQLRPIKHDT